MLLNSVRASPVMGIVLSSYDVSDCNYYPSNYPASAELFSVGMCGQCMLFSRPNT